MSEAKFFLKHIRNKTIDYLKNSSNKEADQSNVNFIPFTNERDKLGILLSSLD